MQPMTPERTMPETPVMIPMKCDDMERVYEIPHWYAVYTCANREKLVAARLASRGIEHFLPLYDSVREWSDRKVKLQMPLFPGYLFVRTALKHRLPVITVPGVVNLVSSGGQPAPVPSNLILQLRDNIKSVAAQPYPSLPVGQRVSICSGPLKGWTGVLLRHKSGTRVVISIDLIERAFVADVDAADLVPDGPLMR
jgi:transcription antitermination factor NusG